MIADDPVEALRSRAAALEQRAQVTTRAYNRGTWIRFALVFIPVPLAVVLFRLHLEPWGYYVAGPAFFVSAAVLFMLDSAASTRRDEAVRAAEEGLRVFREAVAAQEDGHAGAPVTLKPSAG